jgi:tetratricopeptide (TPR) repeat protein
MTYDAFISYSHASDATFASRLQAGLQRVAKPWYKLRSMHIFLDETNLAATPSAWASIEVALNASRFFILVASPAAARSEWVTRELQRWLELGRAENLLVALSDGEIAWATDPDGRVVIDWPTTTALPEESAPAFPAAPIWVDMRTMRSTPELSLGNHEFLRACARLAAPVKNVELETIIASEYRERRKNLVTAWATGVALLVFGVVSFASFLNAERERQAAEQARLEAEESEHIARRQFESARTALSLLIQDDGGSSPPTGNAARSAQHRNGLSKALTELEQIGEIKVFSEPAFLLTAETHFRMGQEAFRKGDMRLATESYQSAISIYYEALESHPNNVAIRRDIAKALFFMGRALRDNNNKLEAKYAFDRSARLFGTLSTLYRYNEDYKTGRALALCEIALIDFYFGNIKLSGARYAEEPGSAVSARKEAEAIETITAAERNFSESIALWRELLEDTPKDEFTREKLAFTLGMLSRCQESLGKTDESIRQANEALVIYRELEQMSGRHGKFISVLEQNIREMQALSEGAKTR